MSDKLDEKALSSAMEAYSSQTQGQPDRNRLARAIAAYLKSADTAPAAMLGSDPSMATCAKNAQVQTAPAAMPGEIERLERALRHAATTASNDDYTKAGTVERARHVDRVTAMLEAADALRAFAPILAEKERRDAWDREAVDLHRWMEELAEKPPEPTEALKQLFRDYKASGIESVGLDSPHNACCYREQCKALEARALAAEAESDTFKLALVAEKERADMAVRQMIKQNDRLAAIRAQGE